MGNFSGFSLVYVFWEVHCEIGNGEGDDAADVCILFIFLFVTVPGLLSPGYY